MKTFLSILTLAIALGLASQVLASDEAKDSKQPKAKQTEKPKVQSQVAQTPQAGSETTNVLTGSYIKQKIRRQGMITDGANNVVVIDQKTIERSGASDVKQLLVHQGIH